MLRAFEKYFKRGSVLELGCFQGEFTKRLVKQFDNITCIEASENAIKVAKESPALSNVEFILSTFENAKLDRKFENILLLHVLEHIDNRIALLKKIKDEWLSDEGILIIACPNANAPSRQIAVSMGLIKEPEAVTPAEEAHGHRVTYSMKTLENDILKSGLSVIDSSGIFFKALANFQWDKLLETDIVSEGYLDGCYEVGKKYPELCASIFFVCMK